MLSFAGKHVKNAEVKSIDINPMRPELIAVGIDDPFIRVYDRRMFRKAGTGSGTGSKGLIAAFELSTKLPTSAATFFCPVHLSTIALDPTQLINRIPF